MSDLVEMMLYCSALSFLLMEGVLDGLESQLQQPDGGLIIVSLGVNLLCCRIGRPRFDFSAVKLSIFL